MISTDHVLFFVKCLKCAEYEKLYRCNNEHDSKVEDKHFWFRMSFPTDIKIDVCLKITIREHISHKNTVTIVLHISS